jgi:hypothetical protein
MLFGVERPSNEISLVKAGVMNLPGFICLLVGGTVFCFVYILICTSQ